MKKLNETRKLVQYNWKALLGFEIIYKFASVVIFVPLLWGMFDLIMRVRGYAYLTLENIASFLANPLTVFLLLALLILVTMYAMIDISAVIFILDQARQKNKVYFLQILKFSVGNAARAWKPKNLMLVVTVLLLMPFLNMGMASGVLSSISIPEFILDYIRADSFLSGLFHAVVLLLAALMMRWLYAFHYFTLEGCSFREARRKSSRLSRKKKLRDFGVMLLLQLVYGLCYMLYLLLLVTLAVAAGATAGLISRVHNAGKELFVWTVNTEDRINRMIDLNVDNIITDDIELAKQCVYESRYGNLLKEYLKMFQ